MFATREVGSRAAGGRRSEPFRPPVGTGYPN
jgi:hypothetical protein